MSKWTSSIVLVAAFAVALGAVAGAQGKPRGPKPATAHGPKTTAVATRGSQATGSHGPKTTAAKGAKTTAAKGPKTTTARGPNTTSGTSNGAKARTTQSARQTEGARQTDVTPTAAPNLPKNAQLQDRLRQRLGLPAGTDLTPYAADFKNQGQFIAAVNNAYNHKISFTELKNLMVNEGLSLGEAKQRLGVGVNAQDEARRAPRPPQ